MPKNDPKISQDQENQDFSRICKKRPGHLFHYCKEVKQKQQTQ